MKQLTLLLAFLMFGFVASSQTIMINNQTEWNALVPGANAVFNGETIVIMGNINVTNGLSINTNGTLTIMQGASIMVPAGLFIDASSVLQNYGTLTVNGGADWLGRVVNTGTITLAGAIVGGTNTFNCGTIRQQGSILFPGQPIPTVGIPCNDQNPLTENDRITASSCRCAGTAIAIPTLGEWGMIILGLITMIFGVVALGTSRKSRLA